MILILNILIVLCDTLLSQAHAAFDESISLSATGYFR